MHAALHCLVAAAAITLGPVTLAQTITASFDDLSALPAVNAATGLYFANGDSLLYQGVIWDERFKVVGAAYRVDPETPGPLYGIPHSGNFFVTSEFDDPLNDGLSITTPLRLTGAWFGRNAYYGFGAGADQVTIHAVSGAQVMESVVFDLPDTNPGDPAPLQFVNTADSFAGLVGITGYRIDRRALGEQNGHWVADDFTFAAISPVPEPTPALMWLAALGVLLAGNRVAKKVSAR